MLRYLLTGLALKMLSSNDATKSVYHAIGNILGKARVRINIDDYLRHGNEFINLCNKYHVLKDGDNALEIGTGWYHWYSLYLRLYYRVNITMVDVCDNRRFEGMKYLYLQLKATKKHVIINTERGVQWLESILAVDDFDQLYNLFGLQYFFKDSDPLSQFKDGFFDCIFSFNVLEHVSSNSVNDVVRDIHRLLRPGGYSIQQIGIDDHLSHYDRKASLKNYLRYSDWTWKTFFENELQYFNRLQMSAWLSLFDEVGFNLVDKITESANIESIRINPKYWKYGEENLKCTLLTLVHRKQNSP